MAIKIANRTRGCSVSRTYWKSGRLLVRYGADHEYLAENLSIIP
ncbi:hypothetical protein [Mycobacterium sp. 1164966.3]|nr:hypothetical protein [Mycobacterium sp. 1164966.3]